MAPTTGAPATRRRRTQAERRDESRTAMVQAAMKLLAAGGYRGMTLARIAHEVGCSEALTVHHFGSKAGVLRAVVAELHERFHSEQAALDGAGDRNGRQRVLDWVDERFAEFLDEPRRARAFLVVAIESAVTVPDLAEVIRDHNRLAHTFVSDAVRRGMADGSVTSTAPVADLATAVIALVRGVGYEWFSDPTLDLRARRRAVRSATEVLLTGP